MTQTAVTTIDAGKRAVSRRALVQAPAAEVFALVADPHRHHELDGSGTVRDTPVNGPHKLSKDAKFTVGMKQYGVPYKITSTVTGYDENKLIEWKHPLGHYWRWEFAETQPGVTQVTETFDYTPHKAPFMLELFGFPKKNGAGITSTLQELVARFA
jgi:ribosome-associated toxin RatA of RatAB toxin-antitoxin module